MTWTIQHKFCSDHLDHFAPGQGSQSLRRLPGRHEGVFQHPALNELPGLQGVVCLLDQIIPDSVFPHNEDGIDAVGQSTQLGALFA